MKALIFIFATTIWTSFSLIPYRIFNIYRIYFIKWNEIPCDQRTIISWVAWPLLYILTLNPIINPLITALVYAPYRIMIKMLVSNIPTDNVLQYVINRKAMYTSLLCLLRKYGKNNSADHEMFSLRSSSLPEELTGETGRVPSGSADQLRISVPGKPKNSAFQNTEQTEPSM